MISNSVADRVTEHRVQVYGLGNYESGFSLVNSQLIRARQRQRLESITPNTPIKGKSQRVYRTGNEYPR